MSPGETGTSPGTAGAHHGDRRGAAALSAVHRMPLAYGELAPEDAEELDGLKRQIQDAVGLVCQSYKEKCLRRRLAVRMRARGVHRYGDYARLLDEDLDEYGRLLTAVTINVSKFFRNPEVWELLRTEVVPGLFRLDTPEVRIWSAGAAAGEEPYTLAILLLEYAEAHGRTDDLQRFRILATDVDREVLARAERAEYGELALSETPAELRDRWFEPGPPYRLRPEAKRLVRFAYGDLLSDEPFPRHQHLVLCRNVIIYFERSVQERLFRRFHGALAPGGHLVLGKVETLFRTLGLPFETVANRERIYRRQ